MANIPFVSGVGGLVACCSRTERCTLDEEELDCIQIQNKEKGERRRTVLESLFDISRNILSHLRQQSNQQALNLKIFKS
jgi:predicted metal-binding transcription factor (methanogenesis marker protein 9)